MESKSIISESSNRTVFHPSVANPLVYYIFRPDGKEIKIIWDPDLKNYRSQYFNLLKSEHEYIKKYFKDRE